MIAAIRRRTAFGLKLRLLSEPGVVITDVPVLASADRRSDEPPRPLIPRRTEVMVFISGVHDASIRALNYARSLRATETRAVYFALDPEEAEEIQRDWDRLQMPIQLDIVEAPFRELNGPILQEVHRATEQPDTLAVVIVPEFRVRKWRHQILHNQRALFIKQLLLFERRVILASVPYLLD